MTTKEMEAWGWYHIALASQADRKILMLICSSKEGAQKLLEVLHTTGFMLHAGIEQESLKYNLHIVFAAGEKMGRDTTFTEEKFPELKWLRLQQLTHITTAYKDDQGKTQYLEPFHSLESRINLN